MWQARARDGGSPRRIGPLVDRTARLEKWAVINRASTSFLRTTRARDAEVVASSAEVRLAKAKNARQQMSRGHVTLLRERNAKAQEISAGSFSR
jgi:hypothetical protein